MGALRATVSIRGREIEILFSHIEFSRKTAQSETLGDCVKILIFAS